MRLTILGTGSARPVGDSAQSGILVEADGTYVLFDIGAGIASKLEQYVTATRLSALFVGHFHADHWIDIGPMRYRFPWGEPAPAPLPVYIPPGGRDKLEHLAVAISERHAFFEPAYAVTEYESGQTFRVGPLTVTPHAVGHYVPAFSMDIRGPRGERVVYAGDMGPSDEIIELARGADLLILEATLESSLTDDLRRGHLTAEEAVDHAERSGVPRALIVHYPWEGRQRISAICAAAGGRTQAAFPGMVVEVSHAARAADQEIVSTG